MNIHKKYINLENKDVRNLILQENRNISGIYKWTNLISGKLYIGSSVNLSKRFVKYFNPISLGNNMLICKALLKYGYKNFCLEIIETCSKNKLIEKEQYYLDLLKPEYNILKKAGSSYGYKHTEIAISKIKNRIISKETLEKMKTILKSKETRNKISISLGNKVKVINKQNNNITEYESQTQAAKYLGVSEITIRRYIRSKKLLFNKFLIIKN